LLRAQAAAEVSLFSRIQWVRQTVAMLDERSSFHGEIFVVRWISGVVRAHLPAFFGQHSSAVEDLQCGLEHAGTAPHPGWLHEVHYRLDALRGGGEKATDTPITPSPRMARIRRPVTAFSARRIAEVVPGRVFALSGFEFTEYTSFVSDDGRELIGIRRRHAPDSARSAYEALRAAYPALRR